MKSLFPFLVVSALLLSSCATQNNQSSQPSTYTISGTLTNLAAANSDGLVLQNNGADNLSVTANGSFHFATPIAKGSAYSVTVVAQPSSPAQKCSVQNGAGTAMASVTNIKVECGHNEWGWMAGSQSVNQIGAYGAVGTSAPDNAPGGRQNSATWTDSSGDLWLFGGYGRDSRAMLLPVNDLWKFSNGQWTWIGGPTIGGQSGNYGTLGVPSPNAIPGARYSAASWVDASGSFWLSGGVGFDSVGNDTLLNDLWKYSGGQWTWMGGSSVGRQSGRYGTLGIPDPNNVPGARYMSAIWVDSSGDVWLFGGTGYDATVAFPSLLSDLWKYSNGQWTWMGGPNLTGQKGIYGTRGTGQASNIPGGRFSAFTWTDASGNLWLFGGIGYDSSGASGWLNDLWKYGNGQWTWMGGSNLANQPGVYGVQGTASASNIPGARQAGAAWTDASGNAWLFGGNGFTESVGAFELNDLWKYSGGQWTWISGSNISSESSAFGTEGILYPGNTPGGRDSFGAWKDAKGNFWLFGGYGETPAQTGNLNDLWMYMP